MTEELEDFRKVGERFQYLGIEMLISRISEDTITVDYVDKNGVLRNTQFTYEDLPILRKQNNEKVEVYEQGKRNEEKNKSE